MDAFECKLEILEDLVYEQEDFSGAQAKIKEIINSVPSIENIDDFTRLLSISIGAIDNIENNDLYNLVTEWAEHQYNKAEVNQYEIADALNSWLNHKLELIDDPGKSQEGKLTLKLLTNMLNVEGNPQDDTTLATNYNGFATFALLVGISENDIGLINQAISAQRKTLKLYESGTFPDYYNLSFFVIKAKGTLATVLLQAFEFKKTIFSIYLDEIGSLLDEVNKALNTIGTDFDREYYNKIYLTYQGITSNSGKEKN